MENVEHSLLDLIATKGVLAMTCQRCKGPTVADHAIDLAKAHTWRRVFSCRKCGTVQGASRRRVLLFRSLLSEGMASGEVGAG